jgi:hypothetical protein
MIPELFYDNLTPLLKRVATENNLTEEHLEELAADNDWSFEEFTERMEALKDGLIAGNIRDLEYPLRLGTEDKVPAARALANLHGRTDVIEFIKKAEIAGII